MPKRKPRRQQTVEEIKEVNDKFDQDEKISKEKVKEFRESYKVKKIKVCINCKHYDSMGGMVIESTCDKMQEFLELPYKAALIRNRRGFKFGIVRFTEWERIQEESKVDYLGTCKFHKKINEK